MNSIDILRTTTLAGIGLICGLVIGFVVICLLLGIVEGILSIFRKDKQ